MQMSWFTARITLSDFTDIPAGCISEKNLELIKQILFDL